VDHAAFVAATHETFLVLTGLAVVATFVAWRVRTTPAQD
jgi:hypothetical protein